jgi:integrase
LSFQHKTVEIYRNAFRNFTRICGNPMLRHVSSYHAEKFKEKRATEVSPVSVNIELKTLRAAFGEAKRLKVIDENPFDGVKPVRVPYKEASYLTEAELGKLLSVITDPDLRHIVKFAVHTMMRRGEIVNLKRQQLDLNRKEIHVRSNGEFRVKGGKPRTVPMSDWVYDFLRTRIRGAEYVFLNTRGCPYEGNSLSRRFKRYVRKAGLPEEIHFHSLRHTGISWLINKGVPAPFVQRLAGHSSLVVTQGYTHLEDQNLVSAMRAFGGVSAN